MDETPLSELGNVLIAIGVSRVGLFNGESSVELILLDPTTGEDFTIPLSEAAAFEIDRRRAPLGQTGGPEEAQNDDPVERSTHAPPPNQAVSAVGWDAGEADQF